MIYKETQLEGFFNHKFAYLLVDEQDHVLNITLNRPERKNAFNEVVLRELAFALAYAHYEKNIWAVVLKANGDIWCAGADLKAFAGEKDTTSGSTIPDPGRPVVIGDEFRHLHKPCIARVHAPAYAGAFLLLCGCTYVVATDRAIFALPEVKRGIWPFQVMASLLKIIPPRKVLDLCIMGKTLPAKEAYDLGIVTHLVADDQLDSTVDSIVNTIKSHSPSAIRIGLQAFDELSSIPEDRQHAYLHSKLMEVLKTRDAQEGIQAFKEKRQPVWTGE